MGANIFSFDGFSLYSLEALEAVGFPDVSLYPNIRC